MEQYIARTEGWVARIERDGEEGKNDKRIVEV